MDVGCVWPISGKEETHTTTREHNSTLTEAEERRAASCARLYTPAAQPPASISGEVVPFGRAPRSAISIGILREFRESPGVQFGRDLVYIRLLLIKKREKY